MYFLPKHWYEARRILAVRSLLCILRNREHLAHYGLLMWASLISLFLQQMEGYRIAGWMFYFLAALFAEEATCLGMAAMIVSLSNTVAHTTVFNMPGKMLYNAGLLISWLLFVPCVFLFFSVIYRKHLVTTVAYFIDVPLGILINMVGILKLIDWMVDKDTVYISNDRNLLHSDRKKASR